VRSAVVLRRDGGVVTSQSGVGGADWRGIVRGYAAAAEDITTDARNDKAARDGRDAAADWAAAYVSGGSGGVGAGGVGGRGGGAGRGGGYRGDGGAEPPTFNQQLNEKLRTYRSVEDILNLVHQHAEAFDYIHVSTAINKLRKVAALKPKESVALLNQDPRYALLLNLVRCHTTSKAQSPTLNPNLQLLTPISNS